MKLTFARSFCILARESSGNVGTLCFGDPQTICPAGRPLTFTVGIGRFPAGPNRQPEGATGDTATGIVVLPPLAPATEMMERTGADIESGEGGEGVEDRRSGAGRTR